MAELLDNSQDRECGSTRVDVDAYLLNPRLDKLSYCLSVQDDGVGMDRARLNNMLSFGFSDKEHVSGNVGRFGIGFKSGSMRLADDVLILTKREGFAHCAMLSQSFLDAIGADDILIPMFSWQIAADGKYHATEPADATEWSSNMAIMDNYCFTKSEPELLKEMDKIKGTHGTRVVLFNLKKRESETERDGEYEFDFSVSNDIRMLGDTEDKNNRGLSALNSGRRPVFQQYRDGQQATLDVPEDYSLRAYMEVLYLRPRCKFTLRGQEISPRCPISRLTKEYYVFPEYKPKGMVHGMTVHCGYIEENSKLCGFHIYNKNRLIRLYQRFASQLQANCMMKDMLGVVEADCLEPTHNKQAFKESDMAYHRMKKHVTQCMNDYYFGVQNLRSAGKNGRERNVGKGKTRAKGGLTTSKKRKKAGVADEVEEDVDWDDQKLTNEVKANRPINRCKQILQRIMADRNAFAFLEPVDPISLDIPDYFEIISHPMDLGTIFKRLEPTDVTGVPLETMYYTDQEPEKFANDVRLVFSNAFTYNKPEEVVYVQAEKMAQLFEREWVYKFPASAYGAGGNLQPDMLKNKIKNLLEEEEKIKRQKLSSATDGTMIKIEEVTTKPFNPDDETDVDKVIATYDEAAKRHWMLAQIEEVLEMKQKMRNQSAMILEQQSRIAALDQLLQQTQQNLDLQGARKKTSKGSKMSSAEHEQFMAQLNDARKQIMDQNAKIQKLKTAVQAAKDQNAALVAAAQKPQPPTIVIQQQQQQQPKVLESAADTAGTDTLVRMDENCIGVESKELLAALHSATDKLQKQYSLLQAVRQREKDLELRLKNEENKTNMMKAIFQTGLDKIEHKQD